MPGARNARAEAAASAGPGWEPLVLEPSPPAILDEPYLADDPMAFDPEADGVVVTPFGALRSAEAITWTELTERDPDLSYFAAERWLACWPRLEPLPPTFASTRLDLHRVAAYVVSPARRRATGKIGLRYTRHGFGTPFFVDDLDGDAVDAQIRIEGTTLVEQHGGDTRETPLTSLTEVASFLSMAPDVEWASAFEIPEAGDLDRDLAVDPVAATALSCWFGFAFSVLEELRADPASAEASRPQLWPEHFDPAIEIGSETLAQRASYGLSPGDADAGGSPEPYLYVSAWYPDDLGPNPFWNSEGFPGAQLGYDELLAAGDQRQAALDFFATARSLLLGGGP